MECTLVVSRAYKPGELEAAVGLLTHSPELAYVLGLLWAEGHFYSTNARVGLEMVEEDLAQVSGVFLKTGLWRESARMRAGRTKKMLELSLVNLPFRGLLESLGYSHRVKGASKVLSYLPANLHPSWWLGFFDGDGCLYTKQHQLSFSASHDQDWEFALGLAPQGRVKRRTSVAGSYSTFLVTSRPGVRETLRRIYGPQPEATFGISRKRQSVVEYLSGPLYAPNPMPGTLNPSCRTTDEYIRELRTLRVQGCSYASLSAKFGLSRSQVGRICRGESWQSLR